MLTQYQEHVGIIQRAAERLADPVLTTQERIEILRVVESLARFQRQHLLAEEKNRE